MPMHGSMRAFLLGFSTRNVKSQLINMAQPFSSRTDVIHPFHSIIDRVELVFIFHGREAERMAQGSLMGQLVKSRETEDLVLGVYFSQNPELEILFQSSTYLHW